MFQRILATLDSSDHHRMVFEAAVALAETSGSQLMLLHVLPIDEPIDPNLPSLFTHYYPTVNQTLIQRYWEEQQRLEAQGLDHLRQLAAEAAKIGVTVEFTQMRGDPARTICTLARDWQADLIVMGRRGLSGLSEMMLGSVSNYVLHRAPCSVLVTQQPALAAPNPNLSRLEV